MQSYGCCREACTPETDIFLVNKKEERAETCIFFIQKRRFSPCTQKHFRFMTLKCSYVPICVYTLEWDKSVTCIVQLVPDGPLGFASGFLSQDQESLSSSDRKTHFLGVGGLQRGGGPNVQNTQINRTGACSYVNVCPMEGRLAVGRAGEVHISTSHYAILANCI